MANTLGNLIGKVKHSFSITNDAKEKVQVSVTFDFSTCTDADIKSWLCGNRAIVLQRPLRALSIGEIAKVDGTVIDASHAGRKVQSVEEKLNAAIAALRSIGMNEQADELEAARDKDEKAE